MTIIHYTSSPSKEFQNRFTSCLNNQTRFSSTVILLVMKRNLKPSTLPGDVLQTHWKSLHTHMPICNSRTWIKASSVRQKKPMLFAERRSVPCNVTQSTKSKKHKTTSQPSIQTPSTIMNFPGCTVQNAWARIIMTFPVSSGKSQPLQIWFASVGCRSYLKS